MENRASSPDSLETERLGARVGGLCFRVIGAEPYHRPRGTTRRLGRYRYGRYGR